MDLKEYFDVLAACAIQYRELPSQDRLAAMHRWRQIFAAPSPIRAGDSNVRAWHVFGRPDKRTITERPAIQAYHAEQASIFYVFPEDPTLPALECRGSKLPDFHALQADIYVWPADLAWTMAFIDNARVIEPGPYFSRREWK